jgi:hypothetical protein
MANRQPKPKSKFLSVRLTPADHRAFFKKSERYGNPSDLLREIVQAFIEDRLVVNPPATPKKVIYHVS